MAKTIIRQGPTPPNPIDALRDEVESMRGELATLADSIQRDNKWIKDALKEILQNLEMKSDRD